MNNKHLEKIEALLECCENDQKQLEDFYDRLKEINSRMEALSQYYDNQYLQDYDKFSKEDIKYRLLDQDSIWNVLSSYHQEKIQLLKMLVNTIS